MWLIVCELRARYSRANANAAKALAWSYAWSYTHTTWYTWSKEKGDTQFNTLHHPAAVAAVEGIPLYENEWYIFIVKWAPNNAARTCIAGFSDLHLAVGTVERTSNGYDFAAKTFQVLVDGTGSTGSPSNYQKVPQEADNKWASNHYPKDNEWVQVKTNNEYQF